ncbi:MAG: IS110 family transposase [Acidobacteriota bacterium]
MKVINIGVDLGVTASHHAEIKNSEGIEVCSPVTFTGTKQGFDMVSKHVLKNVDEEAKLRFICEPTSMSWFPVAVYAKRNGHEIMRVKAQKSHDLRKYYSRHSKSDKLDAKALSMMPIVDRKAIEQVYLPDKITNALDRRCRQREKIAKEIASIKTRIKSLYHWVMPGITDCFEDPYGERAKAFYKKYTNPFKVKRLGISRLRRVLEKTGRQQTSEGLAERLYEVAIRGCELYDRSDEYIDFDELQKEVECELKLLESHEQIQKKVDEAINRLYKQAHPTKNIETIPGVGEALGPVFFGIIGNSERFSSQSKARGYSGMIPRQKDSGESSKKGLNITKDGPSRYRRALYLASDTARQWDPQLAKVYYDQMVHKGNCHNQAVCAVSTHLIGRIIRVLKDKRPYELRDLEGKPITKGQARILIKRQLTVSEEARKRTRSRRKTKGYKRNHIRGISQKQSSRSAPYPS